MRAGAQLRQLLRQLVVHGDQLAVQHHVHVALVGLDLGGGRRHDLGARQLQLERQVGALDDLAVAGRQDGELAGGAGPVGRGAGRGGARLPGAALAARGRPAAGAAGQHQRRKRQRRCQRTEIPHWITCSKRASVRSPALEVPTTEKDQRPALRLRLDTRCPALNRLSDRSGVAVSSTFTEVAKSLPVTVTAAGACCLAACWLTYCAGGSSPSTAAATTIGMASASSARTVEPSVATLARPARNAGTIRKRLTAPRAIRPATSASLISSVRPKLVENSPCQLRTSITARVSPVSTTTLSATVAMAEKRRTASTRSSPLGAVITAVPTGAGLVRSSWPWPPALARAGSGRMVA